MRPLLLLIAALLLPLAPLRAATPVTETATLTLRRGPLTVHFVAPPADVPLRAVIVFASGDGGWTSWEESATATLALQGVLTAGLDCLAYSATDYDADTLGADFAALAAAALLRSGQPSLPVLYGGWSMGAAQSVAAAVHPDRPPALRGLLLASVEARGRYGLRLADEAGLPPTGDGTFALADLTPRLAGLRLAQLHAGADLIGSTEWIKSLTPADHISSQLFEQPEANHGFGGPDDNFPPLLRLALRWLLKK